MSRPRVTAFFAALLALMLSGSAFAQATVMPVPRLQFFANDGNPCNGCVLTGYLAGTTTPQDLYTDSSLSTNIASVTMNSAGRPSVAGNEVNLYMAAVNYKFILTTSGGTVLWTADNVRPDASRLVLPSTFAVGDILYADTTSTLARLADVAVGSYLRSGGVNTAPLWSTLKLPNAATANYIPYATSSNTWGESANLTFNGSTFTTLAGSFTTLAATGNIDFAGFDVTASTGTSTITADIAAASGFALRVNNGNASPAGIDIQYTAAAPNGTGNLFARIGDTGATRFEFRSNGGLANFSANDVNLSDARAKVIRGTAPSQRSLFRRLQFVEARYRDAPTTPDDVMLTAQNVQAVYPSLVTTFADGFLGVKEHGIVMRGLAVVQELDAAVVDQDTRLARQLDLIAGIESRLRALEAENAALRAQVQQLSAPR